MFASAPNEPPPRQLPIDVLERDWQREVQGPLMRERFRTWREAQPALARFANPAALLRFLHGPGAEDKKDAVLRALLVIARAEPLAGRVVLEALRPGLKRLAGRLLVDAGQREELWSELMYAVWRRIRTYPVHRRPERIAANLLLDTLHGAVRTRREERKAQARIAFEAIDELPPAVAWTDEDPPGDTADVVRLVGQAVKEGAISREEAELILQSRIAGVSLGELAREQRISFDALKHRRGRAERRLLLFLGLPVPLGPKKGRSLSARVTGAGPSPLAGERTKRT